MRYPIGRRPPSRFSSSICSRASIPVGQRLEQSTLLLFAQKALKSPFLEHPVLAPALMLRGHGRPKCRVESVGSRNPLHHPRGTKSVKDSADPRFLSPVLFCGFVQGERKVPLKQRLEESNRQRIGLNFCSRSLAQQAKIIHPMGQLTSGAVAWNRTVVNQTEGERCLLVSREFNGKRFTRARPLRLDECEALLEHECAVLLKVGDGV